MGKEHKLHIVILGRRNNGKSSLMNALTGQTVSIVSDVAGTTTDPVKRSYEIPGFASVVFTDTAGIDDEGRLGEQRVERSRQIIAQSDLAILIIAHNQWGSPEEELVGELQRWELPFLILHNKRDEVPLDRELQQQLETRYNVPVIDFSVRAGDSPEKVIVSLQKMTTSLSGSPRSYIGDLIAPGDQVLLITPIDSEAPAGRMILPQVQLLRDVLDNHAVATVLQPAELSVWLSNTPALPALAITDSQVFKQVAEILPPSVRLTSFSILLARYKGFFDEYRQGTPAIDSLREGDRILMLESCSHHVSCEDIGRHKIPAWLQKHTGKNLHFDFISGLDAIPRPITDYAMLLQCGGCMVTGRQLRNRLRPALEAGIPVSNYGMTIAYLQGIFDRVLQPFPSRSL